MAVASRREIVVDDCVGGSGRKSHRKDETPAKIQVETLDHSWLQAISNEYLLSAIVECHRRESVICVISSFYK
jgi:hypothetical protein